MNIKNSRSTVSEKYVEKLLKKGADEGVFAGAAAGIFYIKNNKKNRTTAYYGKASFIPQKRQLEKEHIFDLASITKPLATTLAILCLLKDGKINLKEELPSLLQKKVMGEKGSITLSQLLNHTSGLPAHREYFKKMRDLPCKERKGTLETWILAEELESTPGTKTTYSDLGFMLLGRIIEIKSEQPLDLYIEKKVMKPLGLDKKIFFNKINDPPKNAGLTQNESNKFAATEKCPWRNRVLCGEVHDDNCFVFGGISGHCGLFGDIESVLDLCVAVLDLWKNRRKHPNINNHNLHTFLTWRSPQNKHKRALGFDRPTAKESSGGKYLSLSSVGHLGFSGTSFWIDPEKDMVVVLLSNRVHPNRQNEKIREFRPFFHDAVIGKIFPPG